MTSSPDEVAETLWVLRAQVGDRDAFVLLHERYSERLRYYLRRLVDPPEAADDVLQDVWVQVVRKLSKLEQPEAFRVWLYRLAHNRAVSRWRRRRFEVPLEEVAEAADSWIDERADPWAGVEAATVHAALGRLSTPHREVLTLRFLEGLAYEEIAAVVGCSLGTVRSRIHYAKKSLRARLAAGARTESKQETP